MCARDEVDKKNMETVKRIISEYPKEIRGYIDSMSGKTSFTKLVYARYIIKFINYINEAIGSDYNYNNIKPMHIDSYIKEIRYNANGEKSATYIVANIAAIKGFFNYLHKNEIITSNPCLNIESPKDNKEHEILTISDEDLDILINNINNGVGNNKAKAIQKKWISRDIAILTLGITTGLRVSAIVGIDIDDVNLSERYIMVTEKGNVRKKVYIGKKTVDALIDWIVDRKYMVDDNEKALFICQGKHRMSVRAVENRFRAISKATGKKYTPHKMRATCATNLYEQTNDIYLVQQQLGHKNIANTQRYAKVSEARKREAADILDSVF